MFYFQGENRIRGEFTIVLGPYQGIELTARDLENKIKDTLLTFRDDGIARSEAVKLATQILEQPKSVVYKLALDIPWGP